MKNQKIRIAIAEDEALNQIALQHLLSYYPHYEIIIISSDGKELLDKIETSEYLPEICILDIGMPIMNGYECLKQIKKKWPYIKVIMLSSYCHEYSISELISSSANCIIAKKDILNELNNALLTLYENDYYYSNIAPKNLFTNTRKKKTLNFLTTKEKEILLYTYHNMTIKEIAYKMQLSHRSVETYRSLIYKKLKIKSISELMHFIFKNEFIYLSS